MLDAFILTDIQVVQLRGSFPRKAVHATLQNENGEKTIIEIAPLPGFSKENIEDVLSQLSSDLQNSELFPSVQFALESALLPPISKMPLSYAFPPNKSNRHAKIKIGHLTPEKAHILVDSLKDKFSLRIDLNRKWKKKDVLAFFSRYPRDQFVYIEEPFEDVEDLPLFSHPFALDETLRENRSLTPFLKCPRLKALILKPTLTYPLDTFLNLGKPCVLTSCFESSIGTLQIAKLAIHLGLKDTHHGLNT